MNELKQTIPLETRESFNKKIAQIWPLGIVGNTPVIKALLEKAKRYSKTDRFILIEGDRGTGKKLLAQAIHSLGPRKFGHFDIVSFESVRERFKPGISKEGIIREIVGKIKIIEDKGGGTLVLDKICSLSNDEKSKLFEVLQTSCMGSNICVILIDCTNPRTNDSYYNLVTARFLVLPLRERLDDIKPLIDYFIISENLNIVLSAEAIEVLKQYPWEENVKELRDYLIELDLYLDSQDMVLKPLQKNFIELSLEIFAKLKRMPMSKKYQKSIEKMELTTIQNALKLTNNDKDEAAKLLGISSTTLDAKLKKINFKENKDFASDHFS